MVTDLVYHICSAGCIRIFTPESQQAADRLHYLHTKKSSTRTPPLSICSFFHTILQGLALLMSNQLTLFPPCLLMFFFSPHALQGLHFTQVKAYINPQQIIYTYTFFLFEKLKMSAFCSRNIN